MSVYALLFWDSFKSMFSFSLSSETLWFAARDFGVYNLFVITAICYCGALLGIACSAGTGYAISTTKDKLFTIDEDLYRNLSRNASRYGIYIFLFQMLPFIKIFYLFAGMFRLPVRRLLMFTLAGRALFYVYYLYIYPQIPSF